MEAAESSYLFDRSRWLVRLRWGVIAASAVVVFVAWRARVIDDARPPAVVVLLMATYNGAFLVVGRQLQPAGAQRLRRLLFAQLLLDVASLVALLHWSDALENPFAMFYAFPMVLGAMFLTRPQALSLGAVTSVVHAGVVLCERGRLLQHHPLRLGSGGAVEDEALASPWYVAAHLTALLVLVFGVILFVRAVVEQRLRAEARQHEHARLALSRERLAHVGEVSAGVAHAVRNPLHGLLNCVDLLEVKVGPSEELDMMNEGLRRIETVTRRLLALMRDAPIQRTPTDLDALVEDSVRFMSGRARGKHVRLATLLGRVGNVCVDPDRLGEALVNVLDNAVDASPDGGVVTIRTTRGRQVLLEVTDDGTGMTPEQLAKAFHPFYTTKPVGEGTGLGLAITKRIVEEHGGTIAIRSARGEGTTVTLQVPVGERAP